jgi:hypothetical protein
MSEWIPVLSNKNCQVLRRMSEFLYTLKENFADQLFIYLLLIYN